jgi:hypothetical protein
VPTSGTLRVLKRALEDVARGGYRRILVQGFPLAVEQGMAFERQVCASRAAVYVLYS